VVTGKRRLATMVITANSVRIVFIYCRAARMSFCRPTSLRVSSAARDALW